jgi:hypothetical protein
VAELRGPVAEVALLDRQLCGVTADLPLDFENSPAPALLMPDDREDGSMIPVSSQEVVPGVPELSPWLLVDQDELSIISAAVRLKLFLLNSDFGAYQTRTSSQCATGGRPKEPAGH